mmetsp:Transcript_5493/g.20602  ORF Transcript_5493/g.20602 Transcript_5493/m.20602 type:complete len:1386 (-) Transcript_5493:218-4375(-)
MPPSKKPTANSTDAPLSAPPTKKSLLFNISLISPHENGFIVPISQFLKENDPYYATVASSSSSKQSKGNKKATKEAAAEEDSATQSELPSSLHNLHLYMLIDFHSSEHSDITSELPLYPIDLAKLPELELTEYRREIDSAAESGGKDEAKKEPEWQILRQNEVLKGSNPSRNKRPLVTVSLPSQDNLISLLDANASSYLILSQELDLDVIGQEVKDGSGGGAKKGKTPAAKGKKVASADDSSIASRQKLDQFLSEHHATCLCQFSLGTSFLKRFVFDARLREEMQGEILQREPEGGKKGASSKKGVPQEDTTTPEDNVVPLNATFTVALVDSPGGILSDIEASSYYLRIKIDKLDDLPVKEYQGATHQMKPLHVEYEYNNELYLTDFFEHAEQTSKKIKMNHEVCIEFEKNDVEEWRSRFENDPLEFIVRDRDLKMLPLPKRVEGGDEDAQQSTAVEDIQDNSEQNNPAPTVESSEFQNTSPQQQQFSPTEITQHFATASIFLDNLSSGKVTRINEDVPLKSASEVISIPIPKPKPATPPPEEEAPKKGKGTTAAKKKGKTEPEPDIEEAPQVEYTEEPILVKQGHYLENGTYLRVSVQLRKPLPEPNRASRVSAIVVKAHPLHDQEAIQQLFNHLNTYDPESVSRPVSASSASGGASKGKKAQPPVDEEPKMETIVNKEDYFTGVSIVTPEEQLIIIEGLAESGAQKLTKFLQTLSKQTRHDTSQFNVLANWAITFAARRYLPSTGSFDESVEIDTPDVPADEGEDPPQPNSLSTNRLSPIYLSCPLADSVNSKETHSNSRLLHAASDLLEMSRASNIGNITNGRLWPHWEQLELIHNHFGTTEEAARQALENQVLAAQQEAEAVQMQEDDIPEDIDQEVPLTLQDLYECLGQDIVLDAIPVVEPPPGYPDARKVVIEGEEERWQARREMPGVEDDLSIVEDKMWVFVPTLNAHLLISLLPHEVQPEPSFVSDADHILFQEAPLPPHHLMSSFAGELIGTDLEDVFCVLTRAWTQHASKRVDDKLEKRLYSKPKKYSKNHFVSLNKTELKQKSELIKRKRKLQERIEESKLHPLVREVRRKVVEAAENAPVFMYAGQRDRWSEIQQATMREAVKQSKRKDNYSFSTGDFLSLSFSAISNKEVDEVKKFRKLQAVKNKADFKYPAPRPPGTWTQPDKQLHPSKIQELRTTTHTSSGDVHKLLEHNSGPLPAGKPNFYVPPKLGREFSTVPKLGFEQDGKQVGKEKEKELLRQMEKDEFARKLVVDDTNFHVSHKSRNRVHPLDKRQTMLKSAPKRVHLKKKPLKAEPYSITGSDKYQDVTKRPFQEVLGVAATRTQLPVTLGVRENVASFYVNNKQKDGIGKQANYSRSIKPLEAKEKVGDKWGT